MEKGPRPGIRNSLRTQVSVAHAERTINGGIGRVQVGREPETIPHRRGNRDGVDPQTVRRVAGSIDSQPVSDRIGAGNIGDSGAAIMLKSPGKGRVEDCLAVDPSLKIF